MTELELIQRTLSGEKTAFGELVRMYQSAVFRIVGNLVRDAHMVEDLVQDVFLAAYRHLEQFDAQRASFRAWLFTIARNRCANHGRRESYRRTDVLVDASDTRPAGSELEQAEFFEQLDQALAELPFDQRTAFVLVELEQLSYQEAAAIESTRVGTIKSRVHRAKQRLKLALASLARANGYQETG